MLIMRKQYWIALSVFLGALLQAPLLMAADEVLVPWVPAVIDSDEQAETERRARASALENLHAPEENSEEAWLKKFNPELEDAATEETSQTGSRYSSTAKASTKDVAGKSRKRKSTGAEKKSLQNTRDSGSGIHGAGGR